MTKLFYQICTVLFLAFNLWITMLYWEQAGTVERLRDINAEMYRDGILKNDHLQRVMRQLYETNELVDRMIEADGNIVFRQGGENG